LSAGINAEETTAAKLTARAAAGSHAFNSDARRHSGAKPGFRAMGTLRFVGTALVLFVAAYFGMQWFLAPRPLKPDPRLPTFHRVDVNSPKFKYEQSFASDDDPARDRLRNAVLEAAKALSNEPCNSTLKAAYVEAASAYARAWLSVAPCVGTRTCSSHDINTQLDRAQKAFGSPLDHRVREAMRRLHGKVDFATADFPKEVVVQVAQMAGDGRINPRASAEFKKIDAEFRAEPSCSAFPLQ
jgi:hypothetical protein